MLVLRCSRQHKNGTDKLRVSFKFQLDSKVESSNGPFRASTRQSFGCKPVVDLTHPNFRLLIVTDDVPTCAVFGEPNDWIKVQ
jgi:hypothetical protein